MLAGWHQLHRERYLAGERGVAHYRGQHAAARLIAGLMQLGKWDRP